MTNCRQKEFRFPGLKSRRVEAKFEGGDITSDGGVLLLRQADRQSGLLQQVARVLGDDRRKGSCRHDLLSILRQRVYGLCLGYEDLNDHEHLRKDPGLQTAVQREEDLASVATLCRWENSSGREQIWRIHDVLVEQFLKSYRRAPKQIILDIDATDDPVHGEQEGRFYHGFYNHYCFLPLHVYCGSQMLVNYLRPSNIDVARHAGAVIKLLVKRIRQSWPKTKIIIRADSGFCRHRHLEWYERNNVHYIIGIAKNSRLNELAENAREQAAEKFQKTGKKQRIFKEGRYAALTWKRQRRILIKAEHNRMGSNPRYVITNLEGDPEELYDQIYCLRGDAENRIREQQLDLFGERTSCHKWWANQFRVLLSTLAYSLLEKIRRVGLKGTELAKAQCQTIRLKLLKIGAVILRNTRRIRFLLNSSCPYQTLFWKALRQLNSS